MTPTPPWLPAIVSCNGAWNDVLLMLYGIFDRDFRRGAPRFKSLPVFWDRTVRSGEQYEEGFWHLITRDDYSQGRLPDFRRAERLPWAKPLLGNDRDSAVVVWDYDTGKKGIRTYVWLRDHDYIAVLEKRVVGRKSPRPKTIMFLITAYHVDGDRTRKQLEGWYAARLP